MNRSFISVILGGFGATTGPVMAIAGEQIAIDADGVATALEEADSIVIVPGYGMAVAQAQQSVSELTRRLRAKGKQDRKSTRLNSSHANISYAVFCLKK